LYKERKSYLERRDLAEYTSSEIRRAGFASVDQAICTYPRGAVTGYADRQAVYPEGPKRKEKKKKEKKDKRKEKREKKRRVKSS